MKFGHRGLNHPVREIATGRIDFTSQNHGYAVDEATIDPEKLLVTTWKSMMERLKACVIEIIQLLLCISPRSARWSSFI